MIHTEQAIKDALERCCERVNVMRERSKAKRIGGFMDFGPLASMLDQEHNPPQLPVSEPKG